MTILPAPLPIPLPMPADRDWVFHATDRASRRWFDGMVRDGLLIPVSPGHYLRADVVDLPAARRRLLIDLLPAHTVAGLSTAAWALGGPRPDPRQALHALAMPHSRPASSGVLLHRLRFSSDQLITLDGLTLTTPLRTATDLVLVGAAEDDVALQWMVKTHDLSATQLWQQVRPRARGLARRRAVEILTLLRDGEPHPIEIALSGLATRAATPPPSGLDERPRQTGTRLQKRKG